MWGVWGLKRTKMWIIRTNMLVEMYRPRGLLWPEHRMGYGVALHGNSCGRERTMREQWWWEEASWRSLSFPSALNVLKQPYQLHLVIKWLLNSIFTANNPFHHLQQSVDGTNVLRNAWRHTDGGLGYEEDEYKRKWVPRKEGSFGGKKKTSKKKGCSINY